MNIEIRKTQFVNKGAELMLHAILQSLDSNISEKKIVMAPRPVLNPYEKFSRLGIYPKAHMEYKGIQWGVLAKYIPKKLRELYGIVTDKELDVVLDAGGFEYTDFWPDKITEELARSSKKWKKQGTKVILLPQAFGPFSSRKIRKAIKVIADNVDLIFARDKISYEYLVDITGKRENIRTAPDFTNLIQGEVPNSFNKLENKFCVIPNYRMLDKTTNKIGSMYVLFMRNCIEYLHKNGHKPFLLIHEGTKDVELAIDIARGLQDEIEVIKENNPIYIKGIIGASNGIISSRFHGLVSGLSQGIPSYGTSWSHKYKMLFKEYNFEDGLLDINKTFGKTTNKLCKINSETEVLRLNARLNKKSDELKNKTEQMWSEVFEVINEK